MLLGLCREAAEQDASRGDDRNEVLLNGMPAETAAEALARRLVELHAVPLWRAIGLGVPAGLEQARERLAGPERTSERAALRAVLDLARWWPPPEAETAAQGTAAAGTAAAGTAARAAGGWLDAHAAAARRNATQGVATR